MSSTAPVTRFIQSLYHTPTDSARAVFCTVVRAGQVQSSPDHRFDKVSHPGHELILCRQGRGFVRLHGRVLAVEAGQMVWVNCHHPHAYWPDPSAPWEHWWLRFDGPRVETLCRMLTEPFGPLFVAFDPVSVQAAFTEIFRLLGLNPVADELIHVELARLFAALVQARRAGGDHHEPEIPAALARALQRMRLCFHQPLRVAELARIAGMSPSHFIRSFRRALGTSPIDWLRRERISQAKRRLAETNDPMKQVALQTGYNDQFFFSKDFKRMTGMTPTDFRRREQGVAGTPGP